MIFAAIIKADGKPGTVPLDPRAPVYQIVRWDDGVAQAERVGKEQEIYVSHFSTCPKAGQFSGGNRA